MESFYYVGLDVHEKTISYSVKTAAGSAAPREGETSTAQAASRRCRR